MLTNRFIATSMSIAFEAAFGNSVRFSLFCFVFLGVCFVFLISGHSLQKVVEINLNKQNRFAENKTRTPQLLQPACFHRALPVSPHSASAGQAASAFQHVPGECAEARLDGAQWERGSHVAGREGRLGSRVWSWG